MISLRLPLAAIAVMAVATAGIGGLAILDESDHADSVAPPLMLVTADDSAFWRGVARGAEAAADDRGIKLTVRRPRSDSSSSATQTSDAPANQPMGRLYGRLLGRHDSLPRLSLVAELAGPGDASPRDRDAQSGTMTLRVGMADYAAGRLCAGVAEEVMADGGVVIALMDEQPSKASLARFDGFRETLRRRNERLGASDARSIEVAVHRVPSSSPADPRLLRAAAQAPRVQLAVDFTERSFEQLLVALAGTSADQRVRLVTFDHSDRALEAIELGELLAIVTLDPFQCGYHSVCRMSHFQCCGRLEHPALGRGSILLVPQVVRRGDVAEFRAKSRG